MPLNVTSQIRTRTSKENRAVIATGWLLSRRLLYGRRACSELDGSKRSVSDGSCGMLLLRLFGDVRKEGQSQGV